MNGLTAGAYISLGAYLSAFVGAGMPTISQGNPGLVAVRYLSPTSPVSRYRQLILPDHALRDFLSDVGFEPAAIDL